ncbi:cilia and flagella associated protein 410 isoform X1 [Rhincodon typus]|uniref:cilia and flagella associated protein 410 isoform X1 n=2 Tax=Rhincodon typus TaxID=259920 RepID=UPI00202E84C3|nr:cilia and flagella associated protein 410 isoform X1 [Rhincodon typus]
MLSKKLVLSRARAPDLDTVRRLNLWGSNLKDLSILREMSNVEVITLSVNNISSLVDFQYCQNISELYLRKNNIQNLAEICYLKGLHRLRVLWLSENPCCGADPHRYRMTVLRNLPQLQKLDNQVVTEEEVAQALEDGEEMAAMHNKEPMEPIRNCSRREVSTSEPSTQMESDVLSFRMEETNKIREELGMKPLGRDKFSSSVGVKDLSTCNGMQRHTSNVLSAVLLLLKELDGDGLEIVYRTTEQKLQMLHRKETEQDQ